MEQRIQFTRNRTKLPTQKVEVMGSLSAVSVSIGQSRRLAFFWLCWLQAGSSIIGGLVTYARQPHDFNSIAGLGEFDRVGLAAAAILRVAVIVCSVLIILKHGRNELVVTGSAISLAAISAYTLLRSLAEGSDISTQVLGFIYLLTVVLAILAVAPTLEDLRVIGTIAVSVALLALAFAVVFPANAFMPAGWNSEKALAGIPSLAGPFSHSNTLGIYLVLSAPFVLLFERGWLKWSALVLLVVVIFLSGSRTAWLGLGLSLLVVVACWQWKRLSKPIAASSMVGIAALVVLVPLATRDPEAFTMRGTIWIWALEQFDSYGEYLWGVNPEWPIRRFTEWSDGSIAASAHNLFLQWFYTGGFALLFIGGIFFFTVYRRIIQGLPGAHSLIPVIHFVALLSVSVFEYVFNLTPGSPLLLVIAFPLLCGITVPFYQFQREGVSL